MLGHLASMVDPKQLRRTAGWGVPSLAAILVVASAPGFDVPGTIRDVLRFLGAPGHGVVDAVAAWLRAPHRADVILAWLPWVMGFLFAMGGANRRLGMGNGSAAAWVFAVPAMTVGGAGVIGPTLVAWSTVIVLALGCTVVARHSDLAERFYSAADVTNMAMLGVFEAVAVPAKPFMVVLFRAFESLTWPEVPFGPLPTGVVQLPSEASDRRAAGM